LGSHPGAVVKNTLTKTKKKEGKKKKKTKITNFGRMLICRKVSSNYRCDWNQFKITQTILEQQTGKA